MKKKVVVFLLISIFILSITGCSLPKIFNNKNSKVETINKKKEKIKKEELPVGKFSLISMNTNYKKYNEEELDSLKKVGVEVTMEVKEDKTAILKLFNKTQDLKYDENYFYTSDDKISYIYSEGVLKISNDNQLLSFKIIK